MADTGAHEATAAVRTSEWPVRRLRGLLWDAASVLKGAAARTWAWDLATEKRHSLFESCFFLSVKFVSVPLLRAPSPVGWVSVNRGFVEIICTQRSFAGVDGQCLVGWSVVFQSDFGGGEHLGSTCDVQH